MLELDYDVVEMANGEPVDVDHMMEYVEDAGIGGIVSRRHRRFSPRLVRLFYETLQKRGNRYIFSWDGIDYELTEDLIGRALGIESTEPDWTELHPYDDQIMFREDTVQWFKEFPRGIPREAKLIDRILFTNAWSCGSGERRTGEMLEVTHNVIQGNWVSPCKLIFRSFTKPLGMYMRLPLTIEAIRVRLNHPVLHDEEFSGGMLTCGRAWIVNFLGDPANYDDPSHAEEGVVAAEPKYRHADNSSEAMLGTVVSALGPLMRSLVCINETTIKCAARILPTAEYAELRRSTQDDVKSFTDAQLHVEELIARLVGNELEG